MPEYQVDFVYKTYHTVRIEAESPEQALDSIMEKTYGVEPDWNPDKEFLAKTQETDDPYYAVSVEAHVDCKYLWHVDIWDDPYPEVNCFDSYEEAVEAAGDRYEISPTEIEFDDTKYMIPCKFAESGGIAVELRPEHIEQIIPLLKSHIDADGDSVNARVAYNRLILAFEGEAGRDKCLTPHQAPDHKGVFNV